MSTVSFSPLRQPWVAAILTLVIIWTIWLAHGPTGMLPVYNSNRSCYMTITNTLTRRMDQTYQSQRKLNGQARLNLATGL